METTSFTKRELELLIDGIKVGQQESMIPENQESKELLSKLDFALGTSETGRAVKAYKITAKFHKPMYMEVPACRDYFVLADSVAEAEASVLMRLQKGGCEGMILETDIIVLDDIRK